MTSVVLDASALLALLLNEAGAETVKARLPGAFISGVNYAEVLTRSIDLGKRQEETIHQIGRLRLDHWPFDAEQAVIAASLREATRPRGLSLADRACLALALSRQLPVLTADREWQDLDVGVKIELIR